MSSERPQYVPSPPRVEIRASTRRRSTVSASWEDGRILVLVPSRLRSSERDAVVDELVQRLLRKAPMHHSDDQGLQERAEQLADRYFDSIRASSVHWVGNQRKRWGSCNPNTREIRISDRLRPVPPWVLDAVLVHELAHLIEASHSRRFRALAARFPRMAEADTFLHGFSVGLESANRPHSLTEENQDDPCVDAVDAVDEAGQLDRSLLVPGKQLSAAYCSPGSTDCPGSGDMSRPPPGRLFDPSTWA